MNGACRLDGKVAIVTGATQGLGEAIARLFAARGAEGVLLVGQDRVRGRALAEALESDGARALFLEADAGDLDVVRRIVPACEGAFGRVDCLVNASQLVARGTLLSTDPALFDRLVAVNVRAPFFLMQDVARFMLENRIEGTIVNILSSSAHGGQSYLSGHSATAAMLAALTKNAAFSLQPYRIRVNALLIAPMRAAAAAAIEDAGQAAATAETFLEPSDPGAVARAVAFLCAPESGTMTGALVDFDATVPGCWDEPPRPKAQLV